MVQGVGHPLAGGPGVGLTLGAGVGPQRGQDLRTGDRVEFPADRQRAVPELGQGQLAGIEAGLRGIGAAVRVGPVPDLLASLSSLLCKSCCGLDHLVVGRS